jgi:hypothetical protein
MWTEFGDAAEASPGRFRASARAPRSDHQRDRDGCGGRPAPRRRIAAGAASTLAHEAAVERVGRWYSGPPTVAVRDTFRMRWRPRLGHHHRDRGQSGPGLPRFDIKSAIAGVATFKSTISQAGAAMRRPRRSGLSPATSASFGVTASTGGIAGRVTRAGDGAAIGAATVQALQAGLVKGSATSGLDGTYSLTGLAPGSYDVHVATAGYQGQTQKGITVGIGASAAVKLQPRRDPRTDGSHHVPRPGQPHRSPRGPGARRSRLAHRGRAGCLRQRDTRTRGERAVCGPRRGGAGDPDAHRRSERRRRLARTGRGIGPGRSQSRRQRIRSPHRLAWGGSPR